MNVKPIGSYMVTYPHSIEPNVRLKFASKLMRAKGIRHLPVMHNEKLVGIVSERDLKAALSLPQAQQLSIGDIMVTGVQVASASTSLAKVALIMAQKKLGSMIIVNSENHVIGIFTTTDALRLLAEFADDETVEEYVVMDKHDRKAWPWLGTLATT